MTRGERLAFGARLEAEKRGGGGGTKNRRGDFTLPELRARAAPPRAPRIDRVIAEHAVSAAAERHVAALVRTVVERATFVSETLTVHFAHGPELTVADVPWLLRIDDIATARAGDDPEHVRVELAHLDGRTTTAATLRRRDGALSLTFDDDPFAPCAELLVRGAGAWRLRTGDGLQITAAHGRLAIRPDDG